MPLSDVELLRKSGIVDRIVSVSFDGIANSYILKVRVELKNGWLMDYLGAKSARAKAVLLPCLPRYRMIARWDNAPHYPGVGTFPHHKHAGGEIQDSEETDVERVLAELER